MGFSTVTAIVCTISAQDLNPELDRVNHVEELELFAEPSKALAPASDTCLGMSWEPTIAVDPNNQMIVAASQFLTIQISFDGGDSFTQTITANVPGGFTGGGDPSLAFDSQGRLFITYLGSPAGAGREVFISGYQIGGGGTFVPIPAISWPVSVAAQAGLAAPNNADKEWLAADSNPGSPYADQLYVVWADLDQMPWQIQFSLSTDQGQTWSAAQQLSIPAEGDRVWPPHVAVAPAGDVYVAYHSQPTTLEVDPANFCAACPDGISGQIVMHHSPDGGATFNPRSFPFPAGQSDMTWNVQHLDNGVIPGATFWLQGSVQPWILPDPFIAGRVHVVTNDDPDDDVNKGDAADVVITTSADFGQTWTAPNQVDSGPAGTFQVLPTAAIDPISGAIAVTYYSNSAQSDADNDGNFDLDLLATYSFDGGVTWQPEVDINDGLFDPQGSTSCRFSCGGVGPQTIRIGEYNGVAFGECTAYMVWADNEVCGSGGSRLDTFFDRDVAAGGDLTPPAIVCPPDLNISCTDSTDPSFTGTATVADNCDLDPEIEFVDQQLPGNCPDGGKILYQIRRTWSATDAAGNQATCEQLISVVDNDPPVVMVPPPIVLECNEHGGVSINDPVVQAWLATATAVDVCTDATLINDAPLLFPSGCGAGYTTIVTFTGIDECGNSASEQSSVTVTDTTPPEVIASVGTSSLWPPNHKFVDVELSFTATDICDPDPGVEITVSSDEHPALKRGSGGPIHCPDAVIDGDTVSLSAERSGKGDGRVYRITITATDNCGNVGATSVDVEVRHSPKKPAVDSGQDYDATVCDKPAGLEGLVFAGEGESNLGDLSLLEYALDVDGSSLGGAGLQQLEICNETHAGAVEGPHLKLSVQRPWTSYDIDYLVDVSSDMRDWQTGPPHTLTTEETFLELEVHDLTPISESRQRYMRLRVKQK